MILGLIIKNNSSSFCQMEREVMLPRFNPIRKVKLKVDKVSTSHGEKQIKSTQCITQNSFLMDVTA